MEVLVLLTEFALVLLDFLVLFVKLTLMNVLLPLVATEVFVPIKSMASVALAL
jgi:hypothetical protein